MSVFFLLKNTSKVALQYPFNVIILYKTVLVPKFSFMIKIK